jgi:hypothetical protein
MSRSTTTSREDILFDALAITDTGTKTSATSKDVGGFNQMTLVINNSLNQAGNYQVQYSRDGSTWINYGTSQALGAASGFTMVAGTVLGGLTTRPMMGLFRITYTASIAPASGTLSMYLQKSYS